MTKDERVFNVSYVREARFRNALRFKDYPT